MADKQDTQGLFTSFKEILNKVQEDVTLGIEIIRLRGQYDGLTKAIGGLYRDLGQKVFELYKDKKDPMPAIREMYEEMQAKEEEMSSMKAKIAQLEAKTSSKKAAEKKAAYASDEDEGIKGKTPTPKPMRRKSSTKK
jgi:regulator of replication initiation timing